MPTSDPDILAEARAAWHRVRGVLLPPPPLTISQWADANRVLGPSSPMPGPWRTSVAPFLREIQDSPSPDSGVELTVVMKPVQVGCTEELLNAAPRSPRKSGPRNPLPGVFLCRRISCRCTRPDLSRMLQSDRQLAAQPAQPKGQAKANPPGRVTGRTIVLKVLGGGSAAIGGPRPVQLI